MKSPSKGFIVAVEGGDAFGTTTQAAALANSLTSWCSALKPDNPLGISGRINSLRNPSDTSSGMDLKFHFEKGFLKDGLKAAEFFAEDRKQLHEEFAASCLDSNDIVVYDRYILSSVVHQGMQGVATSIVLDMNRDVPLPNICFLLIPTVKDLMFRFSQRGESCSKDEADSRIEAWKQYFDSVKDDWQANGCKMIVVDSFDSIEKTSQKMAAEATLHIIQECLTRSIQDQQKIF